jgi:hypothetical protein
VHARISGITSSSIISSIDPHHLHLRMSSSRPRKSSSSVSPAMSSSDSGVDLGTTSATKGGATKQETSKASAAAATAPATPAPEETFTDPPPWIKLILTPLLCGCAFGAVFQLSRVHEFSFIRAQLLMSHFLMLKMFLAAAATSVMALTFLPYLSGRGHTRVTKWRTIMTRTVGERRGLPALVVGAGLLGVGMAVCGSCPGTVFAQVASGSVQARWILLGALLGSVAYPFVDRLPGFAGLLAYGGVKIQKRTLPQVLQLSTEGVAVSLVAVFVTIVSLCELLSPWQAELHSVSGAAKSEAEWPAAIPPWMAGVVVGSLQVPLILVVNNHLGCSSSYMTVIARALQAVSPSLVQRVPLLQGLLDNYWQCFLMLGVAVGAWTSSTLTGVAFHSDSMLSPLQSMFGGAMLVVGARIAAGCTSGHGISGMGYLAVNSFIAVAAMFGGGILTAMVFFA